MAEEAKDQSEKRASPGIPYSATYGRLTTAFKGIQTAATPERFTKDFLSTKLAIKGGSATPIIPFLKRTGFLNSDGTPTEIYKQFRNEKTSGVAAAKALKIGYAKLYEINEYVHDASDKELKGVIVQATGLDANSPIVKQVIGSFKSLKAYANFDQAMDTPEADTTSTEESRLDIGKSAPEHRAKIAEMKLGYTINLNLPATSDIAVFNAIFKSLRDHLLDD